MHDRMCEYVREQIIFWKGYLQKHPDSEILPEIMDGIKRLKDLIR